MVQMFMRDLKKVSALWSVRFRVSALERFCYKEFLRNSSGTKFFDRLRVRLRGCPLKGGSTVADKRMRYHLAKLVKYEMFVYELFLFLSLSNIPLLFLLYARYPSTISKFFTRFSEIRFLSFIFGYIFRITFTSNLLQVNVVIAYHLSKI